MVDARQAWAVIIDVTAVTEPDLGAVDAVARLVLAARRLDCDVRLGGVSPALRELLCLAGLDEVVPTNMNSGSGVEPQRQPEQREQPRRVQEGVDRRDPAG